MYNEKYFFTREGVFDLLEEREWEGALDWVFISHKVLYFTVMNLVQFSIPISEAGINIKIIKRFYIGIKQAINIH